MIRSLTIALALLAACVGLAACGGDEESQAEAGENLCQSLDAFAASVVALQGVSLQNSSEDDVKSATANVEDAWDQIVEDAKDVKDVSTDSIESAYDELRHAIQDRPTDEPITQVVAGLGPKIAAFGQAWKDLAASLDCSSAS